MSELEKIAHQKMYHSNNDRLTLVQIEHKRNSRILSEPLQAADNFVASLVMCRIYEFHFPLWMVILSTIGFPLVKFSILCFLLFFLKFFGYFLTLITYQIVSVFPLRNELPDSHMYYKRHILSSLANTSPTPLSCFSSCILQTCL